MATGFERSSDSVRWRGRVWLLATAVGVVLAVGAAHASGASAYVYWANGGGGLGGTVGRANLDGTGAGSLKSASKPTGVAVDGTHVYWADRGYRTIGRANLNGTGVNQSFITGANRPTGVAVDGTHVYWANGGGGSGTTIGRANLNGTGANQSFITGVFDPWGVAVDALLPPAPVISSARLSSPAFRAAARGASLTALSKTGTDIRYRDSQAATTTFGVFRGTGGHKTGRLCVAGAPRKNQKPCTRFVSAGSFTHKDQAGNIKVHFTGRVRGQKLSPGSYRLALTPLATPKRGRTVTLDFSIIR